MSDPADTTPRPASQSESLLVKWMGITDANSAGFVHGGDGDEALRRGSRVGRASPLRPADRHRGD